MTPAAAEPAPTYRRVLALETSTLVGGLALLDGDEVCARRGARMAGAHSKRLLAMLDGVLDDEGLRVEDLDLLVASLGPGSFTGLRIGLATLKGLAFASGVPVVGVSSLEVLAAAAAARDGLIAPVLDARKAEVYGALYRSPGDPGCPLLPETVLAPGAWSRRVADAAGDAPVLWLGSGVALYGPELLGPCPPGSRLLGPEFAAPAPALLALRGRLRDRALGPAALAALQPNYLRPAADGAPANRPPAS